MSVMKVAVIGAGIMGLTTAHAIRDSIPSAQITVIAEDFSPNTTSDFSTGHWHPFCFSAKDCSEENMLKWSRVTYDKFFALSTSPKAGECGAQIITSYVLSSHPTIPDPTWADCVIQYQKLGETELKLLGFADKARSGFSFLTFTVEMKKYLPCLQKCLEEKNVEFKQMKVESLSQMMDEASEHYDFVFNCTEKGAEKLFNDKNVRCIRGHVLMVDAPWLKYGVTFDDHPKGCTYVLPLLKGVMIGGTVQKTEPASKSDDDEFKDMFKRAVSIVKSLQNAQVTTKDVGTWSYRTGGARLEIEYTKYHDKDVKIIHNYGHGGSGITLSWGCADECVELMKKAMTKENF